ncbi:hypothetical protein [uncultured Shewanella sp.]|nr:hypothetical protein [uncultured Shewanella sp.]
MNDVILCQMAVFLRCFLQHVAVYLHSHSLMTKKASLKTKATV